MIKQRDFNEHYFSEYITDYHKLIKKIESKNHQIKMLTSQFANGIQAPASVNDSTKFNQLKEENQMLYKKLAEKNDDCFSLNEKLEKMNSKEKELTLLLESMTNSYNQEKKKHDIIKLTMNEIIDRLDRTNCEFDAITKENYKLKADIKTLQADNALLFKKIVALQDQVVSFYNFESQENSTLAPKEDEVLEFNEETKLTKVKSMSNK